MVKVVFRIYYNQKGEYATSIFGKKANLKIRPFTKKNISSKKGEYDIRLFNKNIFCIEKGECDL